jgi:hypothetical protein
VFFFLDHLHERPAVPARRRHDLGHESRSKGIAWGLRLLDKDRSCTAPSLERQVFVMLSDGESVERRSGALDRSKATREHVPLYRDWRRHARRR